MPTPDECLERLRTIITEFGSFLTERGTTTEEDTRAKVIDRVLTDVLQWPEIQIDREYSAESGRLDYRLRVHGSFQVVVEAKRGDEPFTVPTTKPQRQFSLSGTLVTDANTRAAIEQVRGYCDDCGIRFAIATNGNSWIIFRAVRDDSIGWKKGHARVFPSLEYIAENFTEFLDLLSYEAIGSGSLNAEFSATVRTSRRLLRVITKLFNSDLPLRRNKLDHDMEPIVKLVFEDIADQAEIDVLQQCYIHTGTLTKVANDLASVLTESIPQFLADVGAKSIGSDSDRKGFLRTIKDAIRVTRGELFLLLGGIGAGKSTFLKRFQRTTGKEALTEACIPFSIDFIRPPVNPAEMEPFVWQKVLDQMRGKYAHLEAERRKNLREAFEPEILAAESTLLLGRRKNTPEYDDAMTQLLAQCASNVSTYVPRLVRSAAIREGKKPVLFIDNVDQLSPSYQALIFLLAQHVTGDLNSVTVVALREESYYTANIKRTFTAYNSRKFHIAAPHFRRMIGNRIAYALYRLRQEAEQSQSEENAARTKDIRDFLLLVEGAIRENDRIAALIKATCYGNMRKALEMFCTFISSGVTNVEKMLNIYRRDGWYDIAFHEFVKSIMLGDRSYYKEEQSPFCNLFNVGPELNSSHFTSYRILKALERHRGSSSAEGMGYVEASVLIAEFESIFDNHEDAVAALNRMIKAHLIEPNTRSAEGVAGASHVRVTSAGIYYANLLCRTFVYLDLVLQDTPLDEDSLEHELRQSVYTVSNMPDNEGEKLERVQARFKRVELFLDYLKRQEVEERQRFSLDDSDHPLAIKIMDGIESAYIRERDWVLRRLRENREKYREEHEYGNVDLGEEGDEDEISTS